MEQESDQKLEKKFLDAYDAHGDAIFRFCFFKLSNREKALEITQDVFTKSWEYVAKGYKIKSMKALLYKIARNAVIDEYRRKKTFSLESIMLKDSFVVPDTHDYEAYVQKDDIKAVLNILTKVAQKYKDVLILRYVENLPVKEIAKRLGITENATSVRIHRATEILRNEYKNNIKYGTI